MTEVLPFIVIAVMILVRGKRLPTRGESNEGRLPRAPLGRRPMLPIVVAVPVGAVLLALTTGGWRAAVIQSIVTACVCLSLVVLTGFVGQVSLAQAAFAGVGRLHARQAARRRRSAVPARAAVRRAGDGPDRARSSRCPRSGYGASTWRSSRSAPASPSTRSCSATSRSPAAWPASRCPRRSCSGSTWGSAARPRPTTRAWRSGSSPSRRSPPSPSSWSTCAGARPGRTASPCGPTSAPRARSASTSRRPR